MKHLSTVTVAKAQVDPNEIATIEELLDLVDCILRCLGLKGDGEE